MAKQEVKDQFDKEIYVVYSRARRMFKANSGYSQSFSDAKIFQSRRSLSAVMGVGVYTSTDLVPLSLQISISSDDLAMLSLGAEVSNVVRR